VAQLRGELGGDMVRSGGLRYRLDPKKASEAERRLPFVGSMDCALEILTAQHNAEHRTPGLQHPAGAERSKPDRVVTDAVDECADCGYGVGIVACDA
jgi:hypothetical protein